MPSYYLEDLLVSESEEFLNRKLIVRNMSSNMHFFRVTLYAEFLPMAQRAKCVVLIESFWAVGAAFEAILALFIMETWGWRWLLIFSSLPLLFFAIACFVRNISSNLLFKINLPF